MSYPTEPVRIIQKDSFSKTVNGLISVVLFSSVCAFILSVYMRWTGPSCSARSPDAVKMSFKEKFQVTSTASFF